MLRYVEARRLSNATGKTYLYKFAVDSPTQNCYRNRFFGKVVRGVAHADELAYFWKNSLLKVPSRESKEYKAIIKFVGLIFSEIQLFFYEKNIFRHHS
jgi:cholinesterase